MLSSEEEFGSWRGGGLRSRLMDERMSKVRTFDDMERAVRAIATHFGADRVFIIGSQSVLLEWPDAPVLLRTSGEIDAYPENYRVWEAETVGSERPRK